MRLTDVSRIARPGVLGRLLHSTRRKQTKVSIPTDIQKVRDDIDQQRFAAPPEQRTVSCFKPVVVLSIDPVEMPHSAR